MTSLVLAAAWCLVYGVCCLAWALGAPGFPFGAADTRGPEMGSLLATADPGPTGVLFATGCAIALVAAGSALRRPRRAHGVVLLVAAAVLLAVVPDVRLLQNLAYSLGGYFGLVDWPVLNQALCVAGAGLLARTGLVLVRSPADGTPSVVASDDAAPSVAAGDAVRSAAARWRTIGRWATLVAVLAPLPYAAQRAAWNLGIPLGVSEQFVDDLAADVAAKGLHPLAAWGLVIPDVVGVLLTLGLIMRWGERIPRWVPLLRGRRVPVSLAVIPASVVATAVTIAGVAIIRFAVADGQVHATAAPGLLWLPWGIALGVATFAYAERRRATRTNTPAAR
ncbi:hypothetical protein [Cryptosporangium minutisporangium]|uniref:Uncharacterized protein n=1 Tax=Cryptosporangium minutisporangium TaxID=113569 RepID=A0ABP6SYH2_9ACTN